MLTTIRQRLFNAVQSRMLSIRTMNGYLSDVGAAVFAWRDTSDEGQPFSEAELTAESSNAAINIRDVSNTFLNQKLLPKTHEHALTIQMDVLAMRAVPAELYRLIIGDIVTAIGKDRTWVFDSQRLAEDTEPVDETMDVLQRGRAYCGARVTFKIRYRTHAFDPYSQP